MINFIRRARTMNRRTAAEDHYKRVWKTQLERCEFSAGPIHELPAGFSVLKAAPYGERQTWTYATCGMSPLDDQFPIELHMFSPRESREIVELLYVTAHYHNTGSKLGLWHTVNFGRPWLDSSICDHGLISLPYLDGPSLENMTVGLTTVRVYWLIPISAAEVAFKIQEGVEALEQRFEQADFEYLNPNRSSVV